MKPKSDSEIFKARIKCIVKNNGVYLSNEVTYIMLILDALIAARHKYAVSAAAKRYNFDFALRAASHYQQYTEAITFFERLVTSTGYAPLCLPKSK
jgi:hypothetical protein